MQPPPFNALTMLLQATWIGGFILTNLCALTLGPLPSPHVHSKYSVIFSYERAEIAVKSQCLKFK